VVSSFQAVPDRSPRAERQFLVEAISTRNENLTAEISAENAGEARKCATQQFMGEGHCVLSATASEMKDEVK